MTNVSLSGPSAEPTVSLPVAEEETVIEPPRRLANLNLREVWDYRELLGFLLWRDVKVRYKQTALGAAWAVVQPVMAMIIFSIIFGHWVDVPSDGVPYPLFAFSGLLPWMYFSNAVGQSGNSIVGNRALVTRVWFPRLLIPINSVIVPIFDFLLAFGVLLVLFVYFGTAPSWQILFLPAFLLLAMLTALGIGLWLSSLTVQFRDIPFAVPFMLQIWFYVSPVVYPVSVVPEKWRFLYSLNPMVGVLDGFRWSLLDRAAPSASVLAASIGAVVVLLVSGLVFFKSTERRFADVI